MRHTPLLAAALVMLSGTAARADTVEVSSTTFVTAGQQTRYTGGSKPDLITVVPAFELVSIKARDVTNPFAEDLQVVVSSWASWDLADMRWDNGTSNHLTGDVTTGYLQAKFAKRHLTVRLGRTFVGTGAARMIQVDGGEAIAFLPAGFRLSAYAGSPVSQRFASRSGVRSWNPAGGDLAYGGRASWSLAIPGYPGRGLDLGASYNRVNDGSDVAREEVAGDVRLQPLSSNLTLAGFGAYSLPAERMSEANVAATWSATRKLHLTADWRFTAPDLLLSRNSILSVFSAAQWNEYGGGIRYDVNHGVQVGVDYHLTVEPPKTTGGADVLGNEASARLDWERPGASAGAEVFWLDTAENGYTGGRVYGRKEFGKYFASADVLAHAFREKVNGESLALTGTLSAGVNLTRGWSAAISGRAGVTPYLEQTFDVMAKLAYNQTYTTTEVR